MFGVVVNVTEVPGQKGLGKAVMETPAGRPMLPIIVISFDKAGLPVMQARFEVIIHVTLSPVTGL